MKALIKYLPVDKVKEGDFVGTNHNNNSGIVTKIIDGKNEDKIVHFGRNYFTTLSLLKKSFIVTQNIYSEKELKAGDIVYDVQTKWHGKLINLMQEFSQVKFVESDYKKEGMESYEYHNVHTNRLQKILGEVSPKATFVEDGKEYEIKLWCEYWGFTPACDGSHEQYTKKNIKHYFRIKCPCCGDFK